MTSFNERQKKLFNHLKDAEEQYNFSKFTECTSQPDYGVIDKKTYKKVKREMKQFRGRESIFNRPEANMRECLRSKSVPDYMKNPKKWKYYSLSDVTPEQMSDKCNTQTALAFIREMEEREIKQDVNDVSNIDETDVIFKKPIFKVSKSIKDVNTEEHQPVFKSNKVIMPEYVVGVSGKKSKCKRNPIKQDNNTDVDVKKAQLKLNHLYEIDDEEST